MKQGPFEEADEDCVRACLRDRFHEDHPRKANNSASCAVSRSSVNPTLSFHARPRSSQSVAQIHRISDSDNARLSMSNYPSSR